MDDIETKKDTYGFYLFPIKTGCTIYESKKHLEELIEQTFPGMLAASHTELVDSLMYNLIVAVRAVDEKIEDWRNE